MTNRPPIARLAVAALFLLSGVNQLVQVPGELFDADGVRPLGWLHVTAGLPGLLTAWGAWRATRWAWVAALAWAGGTAVLILSLESLLRLPPDEARGFVPAVVVVAVVGTLSSWYLFRAARRLEGNTGDVPRD